MNATKVEENKTEEQPQQRKKEDFFLFNGAARTHAADETQKQMK